MGINIGDNNEINNSTFSNQENENNKKNFVERHPFLIGILASLIAGLILMFSFWDSIIAYIEGVLK